MNQVFTDSCLVALSLQADWNDPSYISCAYSSPACNLQSIFQHNMEQILQSY